LITQVLYIAVFCGRYLDIFSNPLFEAFIYFYLFVVKAFYILSSAYIVFLMTFAYARTREKEQAWRFGIYCLAAALILATPVCKIFEKGPSVGFEEGAHGNIEKFMYWHPFKFSEVNTFSP
jgi:ER lumen protein retaining receptor